MTDLARLGLQIESSSAVKATSDLARFRAEGAKADAAARSLAASTGKASGEFSAAARQLNALRSSLDPVYSASKQYEAAQRSVNAAVRVGAATQAEASRIMDLAEKRYLGVASGARQAADAAQMVNVRMAGGMGGIRNFSLQLGQVAQQGAVTGDYLGALAIQSGDMLLGFGTLGAVLGVVAAVLAPMAINMLKSSDAASALTFNVTALKPILEGIGAVMAPVGSAISSTFTALVENLDRVVIIAGTAATLFAGKYVAGMVAARAATMTLSGALVALRGALVRTGIGALVVGAGELVYQFTRLIKGAGGVGNALSLLKDVAVEVWQRIGLGVDFVTQSVAAMSAKIQAFFIGALRAMAGAFVDLTWTVADGLNSLFGTNLSGASAVITQELYQMQVAAEDAGAAATNAAQAAADGFTAPLKSLGPLKDAVEAAEKETVSFNDALDKTKKGAKGAGKALKEAKNEAEAYEKALKDAAMTAEELGTAKANILVRGIDGVADAFGDFIGRGLTDFKGFVKDILSSFTGMISEMIAMAARNRIMLSMGISATGVTGAAASMGQGGGMLGGLLGSFGSGGSILGMGGFAGGTGLMGGLGNAISGGIGNLFNIGANAAAAGGGLAASIGAALPVIGIAAAAFSFLKSKTVELNTGIRVTINGMEALVETFRTVEKTKFWGLSKKVKTSYEIAEREMSDPIQNAINGIGERVMGLADVLGLASENIANTSFKFQVDTKDKSDAEVQQAIEAELGRLGDTFASAVIGSYTEFLPDEAEIARIDKQLANIGNVAGVNLDRNPMGAKIVQAQLEQQRTAAETAIEIVHLNDTFAELQREGEGSLDTLERVVASLQGVNEALYLFDRAALDMSVSGASAAAKLVDLVGGLEAFGTKTQYIFGNFLTDAGQDARLTEIALEQLKATFDGLHGVAVPETHAQFMALLDAQDLMTEGGRNTYAALMDVASAFVQVNGTAQDAANALRASRQAEVTDASAVLAARSQAVSTALTDAEAALRRAFDAERDRINAAYQAQLDAAQANADAARANAQASADAAQERVSLYRSIVDALESAYSDRRVLTAIGQQMRLSAATAFLRAAVGAGGTSDLGGLEQALDAVSDPSTALYESFAAYQQAFNVNTNLIDQLRGLSGSQLSIEQRTLRAAEDQVDAITDNTRRLTDTLRDTNAAQLLSLDDQLAALLGIDNSVLSLGDAIANFKAAQKAAEQTTGGTSSGGSTQFQAGSFGEKLDNAYKQYLGRGVRQAGLDFYGGLWASGTEWETILADIIYSEEAKQYRATGVPRFASGGMHSGGWRMVGESGPELEYTGPSRIHSNSDTRKMLDNGEQVELLREISARLRYIQDKERERTRITNDWNTNGLPAERTT